MRKHLVIIAVMATLLVAFASPVLSADKVLEAKITDMVQRIDKNGQEYVRFIVQEPRTMQGVEYSVGVPVMAFGQTVTKAKTLKTGDTINCVVSSREYQGRTSYTIMAFLK